MIKNNGTKTYKSKKSPRGDGVFLSDDAVEDFKKKMLLYPVLTNEENIQLTLLAQTGDKKALEDLINHNMRLVFSEASRYFHVAKHLKQMDLIQEATMGIIEAAYVYDPTRGAFSTCAILYIRKNLKYALYNSDDEIRKPVNLKQLEYSYNKLISECLKNNIPIPSDDELCEKLNVTKGTLEHLKQADKLIPTSMNQKVDKDDDNNELESFIKVENNSYDDVIKNIDTNILSIVLKSVLKPLEYFVIYNRFFENKYKRLEDLGDETKVTRQRIKQIEEKALEKVKPYMDKDKSLYKRAYKYL